MKRSIFRKILSVHIILTLVLCGNITVRSDEFPASIASDEPSQNLSLPDEDRPEAVAPELVEEKNHIERLYDKETELDTVIFANQDGTETAYIFDEAVKYLNSEGIITDKSNKLYSTGETNYVYVNQGNDIQTYFPSRLSADTGINLSYEEYSIVMYPVGGLDSSAAKILENEEEYVYYNKAFGQGTALRYKTTFSGFKEDIILYENVGNQFDFIIECGTLIPALENNTVVFTNPDTHAAVAMFDPVFIHDSYIDGTDGSSHGTWNNMTALNPLDGRYQITVIANKEFLSSCNKACRL